MLEKTIDQLYKENRLIAKTIDRLIVEPDLIGLSAWTSEAKLLKSSGGSCLSSTTLLIPQKYVPTYGIDGRSYGFLFNAEACRIYDVNSIDSNSNRETKLQKRNANAHLNLLTKNHEEVKSLDDLAQEVQLGADGNMNEIMLDAWQKSCVGLFVRTAGSMKPTGLKAWYQSLLEIKLIQKYLTQAFNFPELTIVQYNEKEGTILNFPDMKQLLVYSRINGVYKNDFPKLFEMLDDNYQFRAIKDPIHISEYLKTHSLAANIRAHTQLIAESLLFSYEPFDGSILDAQAVLAEVVDPVVGISRETIDTTIHYVLSHQVKLQTDKHLAAKIGFLKLKDSSESTDEKSIVNDLYSHSNSTL